MSERDERAQRYRPVHRRCSRWSGADACRAAVERSRVRIGSRGVVSARSRVAAAGRRTGTGRGVDGARTVRAEWRQCRRREPRCRATARRAAASASAALRASGVARDDDALRRRVRAAATLCQTSFEPLRQPLAAQDHHRSTSGGLTAGRSRYVRAQPSAVLISLSTVPTGIPRG